MESPRRNTKELLIATLPFTQEDTARAWQALVTSFAGLILAATCAAAPWGWPARLSCAVFEGLFIVRCFGLYHDALHGALLRNSTWARALFGLYGVLVLTPPRVWKETHNYHHAHTAKLVGSHVGSFVTVNAAMWRGLTPSQRLKYRLARHGLTILFGYPLIFFVGMCLSSFLRGPKRFWDSGLALGLHVALVGTLWTCAGPATALFVVVIPLFIGCALGAYLFYAQHNFPSVKIQPRETWSYSRASLESSSYIPMGPVMRYFTANLGFHHVHHLNAAIPFYRLPEAMNAVPELQNPGITTLHPRDVFKCLSLDVWDERMGRMVPLAELTGTSSPVLSKA
jgi:acyl-lipid omega-6 desaturase (Delta-12 desaturase)